MQFAQDEKEFLNELTGSDKLEKSEAEFVKLLSVVDQKIECLDGCLADLIGGQACYLKDASPVQRECLVMNDEVDLMNEMDKLVVKLDHRSQCLIKLVDSNETLNEGEKNESDHNTCESK